MKLSVGIVGVTGYAGQELLRLLLAHPHVCVSYLASRRLQESTPLGERLPAFANEELEIHPFRVKEALDRTDLLFLALPPGVAMELAPQLLRKEGQKIVDLSGDFRLSSAGVFAKAYGMPHRKPALLREAAYGLPELNRERIQKVRWVANPGCYPTAALLALSPLAEAGLLKPVGTVIDAKSGITGAGRSAKEETLFSELNENLRAYKVGGHQHVPEMEQELRRVGRKNVRLLFVPHLVPMDRGIHATIYAPLTRRVPEKKLRSLLIQRYQNEPFIRILPEGVWPQTKAVTGTNFCDINLRLDPVSNQLVILSAIDNLGKGAAGQAVQNMNLLCGSAETTGLLSEAGR